MEDSRIRHAKLAHNPAELERFLKPLCDAGTDIFHCSQRRFWEPEFPGSDLNLAGWTKKITGKPTISVGSVTLNEEFMTTFRSDAGAGVTGLDNLLDRMERDEFDLIAIGLRPHRQPRLGPNNPHHRPRQFARVSQGSPARALRSRMADQ